MILYCNSDSYGVMSTGLRYSDFLAQSLNAKVINAGLPGSCNQRIFRNTVRDIIKLRQKTTESILCVICLGSLIRHEWWNSLKKPGPTDTDGHFESFQVHGLDNKKHLAAGYIDQWYRVYNDEAAQTNLLMELVLLTAWLKNNNCDYTIFAGNNLTYKPLDYSDIFIKDFASTVFADDKILHLNTFSFTQYCLDKGHRPFDFDQWGIHGHHGEEAHSDFANFLLENYNERRH